jgi:hypothetical protein
MTERRRYYEVVYRVRHGELLYVTIFDDMRAHKPRSSSIDMIHDPEGVSVIYADWFHTQAQAEKFVSELRGKLRCALPDAGNP